MPHTGSKLEGIGVKAITRRDGRRHMWMIPHLLGQPNFFDREYLELSRGERVLSFINLRWSPPPSTMVDFFNARLCEALKRGILSLSKDHARPFVGKDLRFTK